jgi:hypothetical protein
MPLHQGLVLPAGSLHPAVPTRRMLLPMHLSKQPLCFQWRTQGSQHLAPVGSRVLAPTTCSSMSSQAGWNPLVQFR